MTVRTPIVELAETHRRGRRRTLAAAFEARVLGALARRLSLRALDVRLSDGSALRLGDASAPTEAALVLRRSRALRRLLLGGSIGFAEAYIDGDWDSPDLGQLLSVLASARVVTAKRFSGQPLARLKAVLAHRRRRNTRTGSRHNVQSHYDLGNDFFALWLDRGLSYSAALFEGEARDLDAAQAAKNRRIADLLELAPDHRVLEIGCGWGGLAEHLARDAGSTVDAITISRAQHDYARARIANAGLDDRVRVSLTDYRDTQGRYDRIVSVEMLEAVGEDYWQVYFRALDERLAPNGVVVLQTIVIDERIYESYKRRPDFIQRHIFPGGMLLTRPIIERLAADSGFAIDHWSTHAEDYAQTLALWRARFDAAEEAIERLGRKERFRRLWRYYLAYCEAGFRAGRIDVVQVRLRRA